MIYGTQQKNHKRSLLELWNSTIHWSDREMCRSTDLHLYRNERAIRYYVLAMTTVTCLNQAVTMMMLDDVRWCYRQNNDCIWHNFVMHITILLSNIGYLSMLGASSMAAKGRVGRTLRPRAKPKLECRSNIAIYMPYIPGKLFCRACCGTP